MYVLDEFGVHWLHACVTSSSQKLTRRPILLQDAKRLCREVVAVLKVLQTKRDMSISEVKLTVAIEDPRAKERRLMGIEVSDRCAFAAVVAKQSHCTSRTCVVRTSQDVSGVSRDEMASALQDVAEGRIPRDRIALRELHKEIAQWPFLEELSAPEASPSDGYAKAVDGTGAVQMCRWPPCWNN